MCRNTNFSRVTGLNRHARVEYATTRQLNASPQARAPGHQRRVR